MNVCMWDWISRDVASYKMSRRHVHGLLYDTRVAKCHVRGSIGIFRNFNLRLGWIFSKLKEKKVRTLGIEPVLHSILKCFRFQSPFVEIKSTLSKTCFKLRASNKKLLECLLIIFVILVIDLRVNTEDRRHLETWIGCVIYLHMREITKHVTCGIRHTHSTHPETQIDSHTQTYTHSHTEINSVRHTGTRYEWIGK